MGVKAAAKPRRLIRGRQHQLYEHALTVLARLTATDVRVATRNPGVDVTAFQLGSQPGATNAIAVLTEALLTMTSPHYTRPPN